MNRIKILMLILCSFIVLLIVGCEEPKEHNTQEDIRFEKISYYKYPTDSLSNPFKYRLTYYFDNGLPHRYLELDSARKLLTDYIYMYDDNWQLTGGKYKEPIDSTYNQEVIKFPNDSTQITEWINDKGEVYYSMIDNLNMKGKTYRATFIGDKVHGYDSTFYTRDGFTARIFFTNINGKVFNDRQFKYDSINSNGDWLSRYKIMNDTIREWHSREIYYNNSFTTNDGVFYDGILSTGEASENVFSFAANEKVIFQTRTTDWTNQFGFISKKQNDVFTPSFTISSLDSIYNGAISPNGTKIIFNKKANGIEELYVLEKKDESWNEPLRLSESSQVNAGYFFWENENELYYYIGSNNGDIVKGKLIGNNLTISDSLSTLNTLEGNEFSPFVDRENRYMIFTRYLENDPSQQGFFISYNLEKSNPPLWSKPEKIEALPYGWNAYINNAGNQFLYTDGVNIKSIPLEKLKIKSYRKQSK